MSTTEAMNKSPTISVVIPCYNTGQYIEEAVQSVLLQEGPFELVEVVVVDDHSDDSETQEALARLAENQLVRVLHNNGPRGPSAPRNVGIRAARGEWIAFLDSDDVWLEGGLAALTEIAASEPGCQWITGDYCRWYEDGHRESRGHRWTGVETGPILRRANDHGRICLPRPVEEFIGTLLGCTSATMVKKDLLLQLGGFDETLRQANDYHLFIRLAANADFWFAPKVVSLYRYHGDNISRASGPPATWAIRAFRRLLADRGFRPYRAAIRRRIAEFYRKHGTYFRRRREFFRAFGAYAHSLAFAPCHKQGWRGLAASAIRRQ